MAGEVTQDLDLFRMPVELKVDTDGQTEMKRIDVVGTESPFSVETFGKPRRLVLDPNNWVLKNSPDLKVRVCHPPGPGVDHGRKSGGSAHRVQQSS